MKTRALHMLTGLTVLVLAAIGLLYARTAVDPVSPFAMTMIWIAFAFSALCFLRVSIAAIVAKFTDLKEELGQPETPEGGLDVTSTTDDEEDGDELMDFAIAMGMKRTIRDTFMELIATKEGRTFNNGDARLANITPAYDEDGKVQAMWWLFVGKRSAFEKLREELKDDATVIDDWPLIPEEFWQFNEELFEDNLT